MFKFLLIVLAIYLFFRVFTSVILPFIVRLTVKKFQNRFYEDNPHLRPDEKPKDGKVTIHRVSDDKNSRVPPDLGEYTDYEEIN